MDHRLPSKSLQPIIAIVAAIGGIGYWIGQVNSDRKSFKKFMEAKQPLQEVMEHTDHPVMEGMTMSDWDRGKLTALYSIILMMFVDHDRGKFILEYIRTNKDQKLKEHESPDT